MKGDELLDRLKQAVCVLSFQSPGLSNEEQKLRKTLADMQVDLEKLTARMGLVRMYVDIRECVHSHVHWHIDTTHLHAPHTQ